MKEAISVFRSLRENTPCYASSVEGLINLIRTSEILKKRTETYRALEDDNARKSVKESSPAFMAACLVSDKRLKKDVTQITGLTIVDLDHLNSDVVEPTFAMITNDPHTIAAYITISGRGIRIITGFSFDGNKPLSSQLSFYSKAFAYANEYYKNLTGIAYDGKCGDVVRLSAMCYDENAFYRADALPFDKDEIVPSKSKSSADTASDSFKRVEHIFEKHIMPKLAIAEAEFAPGKHNDYTMRLGYLLNEYGVPLDDALKWALYRFGKEYPECESVIISCYNSRQNEFGVMADAVKKGCRYVGTATVMDIKEYLDNRYDFRWNTVKDRSEFRKKEPANEKFRPFCLRDRNAIVMKMSEDTRLRTVPMDVDTVVESDYPTDYNPLVEYINSLPDWDDKDYIRELSETVTVEGGKKEQDYFEKCLRYWLVAMVSSWLDPKVINHTVLTLIGGQGKMKTMWFNHLLPPELEEYYKVNVDDSEKKNDASLSISYYGLICIDEIERMSDVQARFYKELISLKGSDLRAPYERRQKPRVHIASFCATGNNPLFINDTDEGRRWFPFTVEKIQSPIIHPFNHTGIFSQVKALISYTHRTYFNDYERGIQLKHNENFRCECIEEELIKQYLRKPRDGETAKLMTSTNIMECFPYSIGNKLSIVKIGRIMRSLGYENKAIHGVRGWVCVQKSKDEIEKEREFVYHDLEKGDAN